MTAGTVLASMGSAVLGALVGGGLTALVTRSTLRETYRLSRQESESVRQRDAASRLVTSLTKALVTLPPDGASDVHAAAVQDLEVKAAADAPTLRTLGLDVRVKRALDLLMRDPGLAARLAGLDPHQEARLTGRNDADRRAYGHWVAASLAAVLDGTDPPAELPGPASLQEPDAAPWSAP